MKCNSGKIMYKAPKTAKKAILRARADGLDLRNYYLHEYCGHWHTTSQGDLLDWIRHEYKKAKHLAQKSANTAKNYRKQLEMVQRANRLRVRPWWKKVFDWLSTP